MRRWSYLTVLAWGFVVLGMRLGAQEKAKPTKPADIAAVRQAVEKSLPFLESEGLRWLKVRKCVSCHHGSFMIWAHHEARQRGFKVDDAKVAGWVRQCLDLYLPGKKDFDAKKNGNVEGMHLLLGQALYAPGDDKVRAGMKTIGDILLNGQKPEGYWKYEGQAQRRTDPEGNEATSMWAIVALSAIQAWDPTFAQARDRALAWLNPQPQGAGNDPAALRLIIEKKFGQPAKVKTLTKALLARQNADGGWSWHKDFPSDPYATGQSLYALGHAGLTGNNPAVKRAWQFLLDRQLEDGSWFAPTKKPNAKDNPIAAFWGSAWATMGLTRTLPEKAQ